MSGDVYERLTAALDGLANGFPRTRSNVELRILRHVFTPGATLAVITLIAAGLLTACGAGGGPSGLLEGTVTLGPLSPVEQVGGPPNARPYAATITIETPGGDAVAEVRSGSDGTFAVRLRAGTYRLVPHSPEGSPFPSAAPLTVSVVANATTRVTIAYDTGIR
jgi:hypothetical protein